MNNDEIAETIALFRQLLNSVAEGGPGKDADYVELRQKLLSDERVGPLLPDFIFERRTSRDFWNYVQQSFNQGTGLYGKRTRYIEAQLLPIERQFRPDRDRVPGTRPPEIRFEYSPVRPSSPSGLMAIADVRVAALRTATSPKFDLRKLVRLCEELNVAYSEGCYYTSIMATRALLDHIPPLFGKASFAEVANNYGGGGRSFKEAMARLDAVARKIGDLHLHTQIRESEVLPTQQQVNFCAELDVLISEIVRILA